MITKKIKVYGIVQGVGFRPLVYRIAKIYKVKGRVRNVGGYVEIIACAAEEDLKLFIKQLREDNSNGSEIIKLEVEDIPFQEFDDFIILTSKVSDEIAIVVPDLPVCQKCQEELKAVTDRRYQNPFLSCMSCGPRYTIMEALPYDRDTTTMKDFILCPTCKQEYLSPESRRFHAQTISCNDCGPYLILSNRTGSDQAVTELYHSDALKKAVLLLKKGGILAVKGIGGYHLVCSPFLEETVQRLRKLKGREEKPFAVMFPSLYEIEKYCTISEEESAYLKTKARPIVLLYLKQDTMAPSTNNGSLYCGAFLPYTPLQVLLTESCGPLIMTSANLSNQPIIREDATMLSIKSPYLQGVLYNKRRIVRSVDDSVAKIIDGKPQLIRRSRGYVPYPIFMNQTEQTESASHTIQDSRPHKTDNHLQISQDKLIFAAGGDLKAAFTLYKAGKAVVSQAFGDLEEAAVMQEFKKAYEDLTCLLKIAPSYAVCDLHPNYHSSRFAKELGLPLLMVQHHHAHIASVMAEHDLKERIIGIAFDGTGYGTDGCIWGGEFLICEGADFIRAAHLKYTPILGGDESMKDAKKTAACYLIDAGLNKYVEDERSKILEAAIENKINTVMTSSIGRLFDAAASILDVAHYNHYEGECAVLLEKEAVTARRNDVVPEELAFTIIEKEERLEIDAKPVFETLCRLKNTKSKGSLSLGFHYAIAEAIATICMKLKNRYQCSKVALSGGVFQNTILTEQTLKLLRQKDFIIYLNMAVPPNDGAISLGQTYVALNKLKV